ncbi:uncharacterized protein LOC110051032 [Orbicella faveolata]|uniref:uncharacterized protein LOC110051032 n=1 Tax=Orbicella faveolata TaxID=48498 RepID=UPI0009E43F29|nr:uncharacterized protein LOC110051032 [Orbicella faveolata]
MAEKVDWVEIIEPRTGEPMYANLKSGQCLWEPPVGVRVKKANDSQWWELYDQKTRRYYYYCAGTQTTVWRKPKDSEIIPLARLQTLKAREKRRAAKAKELERREGSSRREGSDRRKRDGSLRKDGASNHGDGSLLRRESSGRKDGVTREGSSSRRHGSREKRERTSSREHRRHGAEATAQPSRANETTLEDAAPVENGTESKPADDNTTEAVDGVSQEAGEDAACAAENDLDKRKSPELPIPELPDMQDIPLPDDEDKKEIGTDDEGQSTPSGTLSRHGNPDDTCEDHLSPSGTIERARQAVESASRCILANRAAAQKREDDSVFVESGKSIATNKQGLQDSLDDSLSIKLRAGGMPATTARLVEACAPPSLNESQLSIRSLRHHRQVSDSVLKDLRRDDDEDDDDDDEAQETKSVGTPSTLPRLSRPSSTASPATGPSKHSTLERSHSIPGSKPPLIRALGAYEEYFSHHKKGVFRRKRISLASMLSWSKENSETFDLKHLITFRESLRCGWELMAICLSLFPPSTKFYSYLDGYINKHFQDADWKEIPVIQYARHCSVRLKRVSRTGAKRGLRKPSIEEIQQAKSSVFHPSMFGATLDDIMESTEKCVNNCDDLTVAVALAMALPEVNRLVLSYLIRFLQIFSLPDMCAVTKMDVNNLSMVWAPNCLRCPSDDPKEIFENTRREMTFMRTLLRSLDTSFMEGVR